jgi:hypothetical protein
VTPSGDARFYNLAFSPDVTENDQPTQIVTQLPSGATGIYLFWDYEGMTDGVVWEARWYRDDQFLENSSKPPGAWQGGERGFWWNGIVNSDGLTDGTYRVELYVADEILAQASIPVGGTTTTTDASITNLIFSDGITDDNQPTNPTYLLPSGITTVYAFFDYANMQDGMQWTRTWYYEGEQALSKDETWSWGASGSSWISAGSESALSPGAYRLELYVEGDMVAAANFTIAGTQSQQAIGPITFAAGVDAQGNPVNPGTSFAAGQQELHFFCDYAGMQDGMAFDERWLLEGEEIVTFNQTWESGESGTFHDYIYLTSGDPLPEGTYTLELYVEGQKVQTGSASIGTGTPPPTPPPPAEGLYIYGYVLDADTGKGIPGAYFVVLEPGMVIEGWDGNESDIYTSASTDANGYFELPDPLERGKSYSMIVWAEGYQPTGGNDIAIGDEPSPFEMEITLQKEQ